MTYLLLYLMLINIAIYIAIKFKKGFESVLYIAIGLITIVLFCFGFLNLNVGFYTIILFEIYAFFYNLCKIIKDKKILKNNIFTTGFIFFSLAYIFVIIINKDRLITDWDGFTHWALVVKNMFIYNNFGLGESSTVVAKSYLSGNGLFQYFIMKINGGFKEEFLFLGLNVTTISILIVIFKNIIDKKKISSYLLFVIVFLLPTIFFEDNYTYNYYNSVYIDGLLGLVFTYTLYTYYTIKNHNNLFYYINMAVSFSMLILIKDFGVILSIIALLIIMIDSIFINEKFNFKWKYIRKKLKEILLIIFPAVIIKSVWIIFVSSMNKIYVEGTNNAIDVVKRFLTLNIKSEDLVVIKNFIERIFSGNVGRFPITLTFFITIGLSIIPIYFIIKHEKDEKEKKRYKFLFIGLICGAFLYCIFLIVSYIGIFGSYEANILAAYNRYVDTYLLGFVALYTFLLIDKYASLKRINTLFVVLFSIFLLNNNFIKDYQLFILHKERVNETKIIRSDYDIFDNMIKDNLNSNDSFYFVSTNTDALSYWTAKYLATPIKISGVSSYTMYEGCSDYISYEETCSIDDWSKALIDEYTYLYLYTINEEFIDKYYSMFNVEKDLIKDNQLYKINKEDGTTVFFELVSE